jgi:hypothetical protein
MTRNIVPALLIGAAVALAGCKAQQGPAGVTPGAAPQAVADVIVVETNSLNNSIDALANDLGAGLVITAVMVDQVVPPVAGAVATTNGSSVTFTPPPNFIGLVTLR